MHDYLTEWQKHAVGALELLKEICEKENIKYFLLAGSVLGAVRHEGMIPWDDDIDVGLVKEDWIRLRKVLQNGGLEGSIYTYKDEEVSPGFPRLYGKILYQNRACIDLFLIVKWTENDHIGQLVWRLKKDAVSLYKESVHYHPPKSAVTKRNPLPVQMIVLVRKQIKNILCYALSPIVHSEQYIKLCRLIEQTFEERDTECYINLYSIYSMEKEKLKKEWLMNPSYVDYEGRKYPTVSDTNAYLRHLYGDYMTPPEVAKRHGAHVEYF